MPKAIDVSSIYGYICVYAGETPTLPELFSEQWYMHGAVHPWA
jgi:hypothetical protein